MSTLILVALIFMLIGLGVGYLLTKTFLPQETLRRELEVELTRVRDEHKAYQQEVSDHFVRTSDLVGNLTQSFHAVQEQLASSALHLAGPEVSRQLMQSSPRVGAAREGVTLSNLPAEPPRDYAPKVPGGILSEHYGLEQDTASRTAQTNVADALKAEARNDEDDDPTFKVG